MPPVQPVPMPHVLDPDRVLSDDREEMSAEEHRSRARELDDALHESCAYARQLWEDLQAVRQYLMDSLPPDPRMPGAHTTSSASPTGPDDEAGWERWIAAYAEVTSVLAGPHGDSGFGLGEARDAARSRRTAPVLAIAPSGPDAPQPVQAPRIVPSGAEPEPATQAAPGGLRAVGLGALVVLAARGLLPRRSRG